MLTSEKNNCTILGKLKLFLKQHVTYFRIFISDIQITLNSCSPRHTTTEIVIKRLYLDFMRGLQKNRSTLRKQKQSLKSLTAPKQNEKSFL